MSRTATFVCVSAAFVSVVALNSAVDAKVAPVRGAVCVQSGAKAREAVSGRGLVCVRTKTGVLRWRLQPKTTVASKYRIGDVGPAGGNIFITPSTGGNSTGLYFEVAPFASEVERTWATGGNQRLGVPGASGEAIGDGAANTAAIVRQVGNVAESSAAVYASEYSVNGFSDWFLPSKCELNEMYKYRNSLGGFGSGYFYSSSEHVADSAWNHGFAYGDQSYSYKNYPLYVRPVRAFALQPKKTTTTTPTTVASEYRIGDVGPAGGNIFITPCTSGNSTGLYFELAPRASEVVRTWATGDNQNLGVLGASGQRIGDGAANTAAIARQVGNVAESSAAVYASEYSVDGFSDWFLPSKYELFEMAKYYKITGALKPATYWSSSEGSAAIAFTQYFYDPRFETYLSKKATVYVRPVRAFASQPKKTTTTTTSTVASKSYRIGDVGPAGGNIFITPSTGGNSTGLYFEVAPFASEVERTWATGGNQRLGVPGASGEAIGDGAANTAAIVRQVGNVAESSAAVYASEYSVNGFSDWFLPSSDELNEMCKNRELLGFWGSYWSSSEDLDLNRSPNFAFGQHIYLSDCYNSAFAGFKFTTGLVRPVRAFP